jgi:hypothetical protein
MFSTHFQEVYTLSRPRTAKSISSEIDRTFKANMALLQESMAGLPKNCRAYLDRILAVHKLQQNYREERASRGLDPQNLSNAARTVYSFNAVIDTQSAAEPDADRQKFEDAMDAEHPYATQAPPAPAAPEAKKSKKKRSTN